MKTVDGFVMRPLGKDFIITAESVTKVDFNRMISLNESAAYLWRELQGREFSLDDMVKLLLDRYEVDEQVARRDASALAAKWIESGIATE